jgi:hypothetical protein
MCDDDVVLPFILFEGVCERHCVMEWTPDSKLWSHIAVKGDSGGLWIRAEPSYCDDGRVVFHAFGIQSKKISIDGETYAVVAPFSRKTVSTDLTPEHDETTI